MNLKKEQNNENMIQEISRDTVNDSSNLREKFKFKELRDV